MYHDAPVEAVEASAVTVHRRPRGHQKASGNDAERLSAEYQLDKVVEFIFTYRQRDEDAAGGAAPPVASPALGKPMLKVALQFPDNMLDDVTNVVHELEARLHADARYPAYQQALRNYRETEEKERQQKAAPSAAASRVARAGGGGGGGALSSSASPGGSGATNPNAPVDNTRFFILANNTFGSCCPDEITALHYDSDCIVHFGEACMSKSTRLAVLYIHPRIRFRAVAPPALSLLPSSPASTDFSMGEVHLLAATVERLRAAIWHRQNDWSRTHAAQSTEQAVTVQPRLVIVATPSSAGLLAEVKRCVSAGDVSSVAGREQGQQSGTVPLDWCSFAEQDSFRDHCASQGRPATQDEDLWVVNGARFPRLAPPPRRRGAAAVAVPVQHFLFIGPSSASHPIHLHGIHQYNCFHYPGAARGYFEEGNEEGARDAEGNSTYAPMLFVVDEQFTVPGASGGQARGDDGGEESRQVLSAEASQDDAAAFLTRVFGGHSGGCGTMSAGAAQSARALTTIHRRLTQRSFNIEAVRASNAVGILVASLAIEGYYDCTMLLHQLLRAYGKRSYIIYVGHLNEFKLANFADTVDCFVVVACPNARHCHFPEKSDNYMKRVVSPAEVLLALTADPSAVDDSDDEKDMHATAEVASGSSGDDKAHRSSRQLYGMPGLYNTEFMCILEPLRTALEQRKAAVVAAEQKGDTAGHVGDGDARMEQQWRESASLIRMTPVGGGGGGALTATNTTVQGSLARLHERAFVGLDPRVGKTEVQQSVVQGKHGIARGYAAERNAQGEKQV